jgi:hypothetical protein
LRIDSLKNDIRVWCEEDRSVMWRLPLLAYGAFLLWKVATGTDLFTPLDFLNLGIHELGHILAMPMGEWVGVAGGSCAQVLAPIYGIWQFLRQRDYFASAFSLAWLGESLGNLSLYIADARARELPLANLFGGEPIHDWHYLLAAANRLSYDRVYAMRVRFLGILAVLLFLWMGARLLWRIHQSRRLR